MNENFTTIAAPMFFRTDRVLLQSLSSIHDDQIGINELELHFPLQHLNSFRINIAKFCVRIVFRGLQLQLSEVFSINLHSSYSFLLVLAERSYRKQFISGIFKNVLQLQSHDVLAFEFNM